MQPEIAPLMRYPPALLDEIRARLPVSQVVARKVKLKRQGREYAGLSPFKIEKTASFFVNDQKGFYHCFASGEHGDIFTFVMKTEGLSFPEAIERLANEPAAMSNWPSSAMLSLTTKQSLARSRLRRSHGSGEPIDKPQSLSAACGSVRQGQSPHDLDSRRRSVDRSRPKRPLDVAPAQGIAQRG